MAQVEEGISRCRGGYSGFTGSCGRRAKSHQMPTVLPAIQAREPFQASEANSANEMLSTDQRG